MEMKIQYFNVFLCRNGEKTNYDLSKLIDIIRVIIFIKGKLFLLLKHQWEMLHRFLMMLCIF